MTNLVFKQNPNRYLLPPVKKDYYQKLYNYIRKQKKNINGVIDIGCATGNFLFSMPYDIRAIGIDKNSELIKYAKKSRVKKNLSFYNIDIFNFVKIKKLNTNGCIITLLGTISTIPDFKKLFRKILQLKPHSILINDWLNIFDVDIRCGFRSADETNYNFGFNILSIKTFKSILTAYNVEFKIEPYSMATTLKRGKDPLCSWHANLDGEKIITNGTGLVLRGYNIYIKT